MSLTRSALVLRELGSAGAASHRGRLSGVLAMCTCRAACCALMLAVCTHPLYVWDHGSGGRLSPEVDGGRQRFT